MELIKNDRTNQIDETIRNEKRRVGHLRDPRLESNDLKVYGWKEKKKKGKETKRNPRRFREILIEFPRFFRSISSIFSRHVHKGGKLGDRKEIEGTVCP